MRGCACLKAADSHGCCCCYPWWETTWAASSEDLHSCAGTSLDAVGECKDFHMLSDGPTLTVAEMHSNKLESLLPMWFLLECLKGLHWMMNVH